MKVLNLDKEKLEAVIEINGKTINSKVRRVEFPYFISYITETTFAIKTTQGNKLHCAELEITSDRKGKEMEKLDNEELEGFTGFNFEWSGARGNGIGNPSTLGYIGLSSDFKEEDFSKNTRKLFRKN